MKPPEQKPSDTPMRSETPLPELDALALLDLAPVIGRDLNDQIIYWGGGARALYGFTAEEALGRTSHELLSTGFPQPLAEIRAELLKNGRWEGELEHVRKDGTPITVSSEWVLHYNVQGRPCAVLEVNHDITARKQAEVAKGSLAAIVENAPDAIIGEDLAGNITSWNPGAEALFGYTAAEAIGRHISILATPENPRDALDINERVKQGEVVRRVGAERVRKDGRHLFVSLSVCPIRDVAGLLVGIAKMAHDMTDIREAQQNLLESREQLARANESLERVVQERTAKLQDALAEVEHFSHTITHDLRAPLRSLQGFGNILLETSDQPNSDEARDCVQRMIGAARKMDQLITDALEYTRAVRQELPLVPVDPAALIRSTIATFPHLQSHRARIRIEGEIPRVLANQTGLVQCFANLLGNAVKFVAPGTFPEIRIWAERRGERAEGGAEEIRNQLSVISGQRSEVGGQLSGSHHPSSTIHHPPSVRIWFEDNGIGITRAVQRKLFTMFQRGSGDYEGTGIGLALVKKVAERMGGTVGMESEPGRGSRFWLELRAVQ
jgi:PAS domain S-box-containing protein